MHPNDYNMSVLALTNPTVIDTSVYGAREPILNGELGQLLGWKIMVTTQVPDGAILWLDMDKAALIAEKRPLDLKTEQDNAFDVYSYYFYREFGVKVVEEKARQVSFNHHNSFAKSM